MAIKGDLVSTAAYRSWGPAATAQASPVYGPLANPPTQEMDAFLCVTAATSATLIDQNGVATTFASLVAGTVYPMSVAAFSALGSGVFIPLYR